MNVRLTRSLDCIDISLCNYLLTQYKKHLEIYHFTEIATPILNRTEHIIRSHIVTPKKVNKELLVINNKAYKEQESICLRPDATPTIVQAFINNNISQLPWKVYTYGPMFTYNHPKQELYQFHQISAHIIGVLSVSHDVQIITMLDRFFSTALSLNNYAIRLNFLGCSEDRSAYKKILKAFLASNKACGICGSCQEHTEESCMYVLTCTNKVCQKIYADAPRLIDNLCAHCAQEWTHLQDQLDLLSVTYTWDPCFIPDYQFYDKTVFTFTSAQLNAQHSFCQGGRYDQLVSELGGTCNPSVGASINLESLVILLEPFKETLPLPQPPTLNIIIPLGEQQHMLALLIADNLHAQGLCIDVLLEHDSLKSMMRKAGKMGASYCLIIGQEEQEMRIVTIKNMISGIEDKVQQTDIYTYLTQ